MNELVQIKKFEVEIKKAGLILSENQTSLKRAADYGESLLENFKKNGINDQTYKAGVEYLTKVRKTIQTMNDKRKPITQMLSEISKQFTVLESELSQTGETVPAKVKLELDRYAAELARKKRELELEAENKRKHGMELNAFENDIQQLLNNLFYIYLKDVNATIERIWKGITLEDFDSVSADIIDAKFEIPISYFEPFDSKQYAAKYRLLSDQELRQIYFKVKNQLYPTFAEKLDQNVDEIKASIIKEFDAKFQELNELATANEQKALQIKQEAERQEQLRAEQQQARLVEIQKAENLAAENTKVANNITTLFETTVVQPEIKVKEVTEIEVKNPAGWIELVLFYFEKEGKTLSHEKLEKKFGFAKKFAESVYMKTDEKITSKFLEYVETAKAK